MRDPHDYEILLRRIQMVVAAGAVLLGAAVLLVQW